MRFLPSAAPLSSHETAYVTGLHGLIAWMLVAYLAFDGVLVGGWSGAHMALACFGYALTRSTLRTSWKALGPAALPMAAQAVLALALALVVGAIWMLPGDYALLGGQASAAVLQVLNHWPHANPAGEDTALGSWPLGMWWPVSVMAQYTLLWALLHYSLLRHAPLGKSLPGSLLLGVLTLVSLLASAWQLESHGLYTHAWECLLGSALAWWQHHHPARPEGDASPSPHARLLRDLSAVGLLLMYLAFWQAPAEQGSVSLVSRLTAVLGVCVLLAAGPLGLVSRHLLAWRPLVWFGQQAVGWVLWCSVLIGMAHALSQGPVSVGLQALLALLALLLTVAWQALCARGLRADLPWPRFTALGAAGVVVMGTAIHGLGGWPWRFDPLALDTHYQQWPTPTNAACQALAPTDTAYDFCLYPTSDSEAATDPATGPEVVLIGDSLAHQYLPGLNAQGVRTLHIGMQVCPPLLDVDVQLADGSAGCVAESMNRAFAMVLAMPQVRTIVLAGRYSPYLLASGDTPDLLTQDGQGHPLTGNSDVLARTLERTLQAVTVSGKQVILALETPSLPFEPAECIPPLRGRASGNPSVRTPCSVAQKEVLEAQQTGRQLLMQSPPKDLPVHLFDPLTVLCDGQQCHAAQDGQLLYRDAQHLSQAGSARLAQALLPLLRSTPEKQP